MRRFLGAHARRMRIACGARCRYRQEAINEVLVPWVIWNNRRIGNVGGSGEWSKWAVLKNPVADAAASYDVRILRWRVRGWLRSQLRVTRPEVPRGVRGEMKRAVLMQPPPSSRAWSGLRMVNIRWTGTAQPTGFLPCFATKI